MDFPVEATTPELCLEHTQLWLSSPERTLEDILAVIDAIRTRTGKSVELVESAVVAVLTDSAQALLLRRRPDDRSYPGMYAFAGGKKDPKDVTALETIQRELPEETGMQFKDGDILGTVFSVLARRERIFQITAFKMHLPPGPSPVITLSDEHDEALFISPAVALERHVAGTLPIAGPATRHWLQLLKKSFEKTT